MARLEFNELGYNNADELIFGKSKKPVTCKNGLVIGGGEVIPELNYTLPMMQITEETMPKVLQHYKEMTTNACEKAIELSAPSLCFEIELLPNCTFHPKWGIEVVKTVVDVAKEFEAKSNTKFIVRNTPVDIREGKGLEHMYHGMHWDAIMETFAGGAEAGSDLMAIESIGGKHIHDDALMMGEMDKLLFALGVVGCKDMGILWDNIVKIGKEKDAIPSGDTACGFANTAMVLGNQGLIPRTCAAVDRVMTAVRTMVAVEAGAIGPDKDCGYEGVYMKAITGTPISMEGRTSACAHSSHVGNIVGAICDMWSNESVQNIRLLGGMAPTVYTEQLVYDCRMMNTATKLGKADVLKEIFVESDKALEPHGYIMDPKVVVEISKKIVAAKGHFERTRIAALATIDALRKGYDNKELLLADREYRYLDVMEASLSSVTTDVEAFTDEMKKACASKKFKPEWYDL